MYLTAHLVRSQRHREGVNAFRHWHGPNFAWPEDASTLPELDPGKLDHGAKSVEVDPGGNSVRGYIDVLAPDGTALEEIERALDTLRGDLWQRRNPTVFRTGDVTIRLGVERALETTRLEVFDRLRAVVRRLGALPRAA